MSRRPLFLICNDDGVHAPGIKALTMAAERLGDVVVVAPHEEKSGFSQALTLTSPLRIDPIDGRTYGVTGTPADCVILAVNKILDRHPDFVLSGINRGSNIGQDTLYSGTIAAAMEGVMQGSRGVAFSLDKRRAFDFTDYADAIKVVRVVLESLVADFYHTLGSEAGQKDKSGAINGVLNINIPDLSFHEIKGFQVCHLGRRIYDKQVVEQIDPRGRPYYWIGGGGEDIEDIQGSDCKSLREGYVTLTGLSPEHVDLKHQSHLLATLKPGLDQALRTT